MNYCAVNLYNQCSVQVSDSVHHEFTIKRLLLHADVPLDMLRDRDNKLNTEVVCDFSGSVAHISTRPMSSSVTATIVQYLCSHSNGSIVSYSIQQVSVFHHVMM